MLLAYCMYRHVTICIKLQILHICKLMQQQNKCGNIRFTMFNRFFGVHVHIYFTGTPLFILYTSKKLFRSLTYERCVHYFFLFHIFFLQYLLCKNKTTATTYLLWSTLVERCDRLRNRGFVRVMIF